MAMFSISQSRRDRIRVDMHVHSVYSERPVHGPLKYLGCMESYTDPETIYQQCLAQGMDLVTITDHNRIDGVLELKTKYPEQVFTGVEATTYFPEDGCKVHLLIYDFTVEQFDQINLYRKNIYQLRDYLVRHDLLHAVAHGNSSVDNTQLKKEHLEKLLVLFNHFEVVNGSYSIKRNRSLFRQLRSLKKDPSILHQLAQKHALQPVGERPWEKGLLGGSDDHGGVFIARTYTIFPRQGGAGWQGAFRGKRSIGRGWQCLGHWWPVTIFFVGLKFISSTLMPGWNYGMLAIV